MPITNTKEYTKYFTEKCIRSTFCDHIGMYDAEGLTLHLFSGEELEGLITLCYRPDPGQAKWKCYWKASLVCDSADHHEPLGF